ncbi:MAG: phosphoribosylformylglycinamidine cyclo-ligase, partial [Lachnospiraceae bacterium]|nr:phosphoribosylformylglycinamidine cyclo-ligase [Lachnospiraceae bacterium]
IEEKMMYNTYNMGIGMMLCVEADKADAAVRCIEAAGERAYVVGEVENGERGIRLC